MEETGFQPECKREMLTKKMPHWVFFSHVIMGTFRFSEKNDALFSHCREESTTGDSVTGVSKPHIQRGRSLVICS